jgi:hypothetical protein
MRVHFRLLQTYEAQNLGIARAFSIEVDRQLLNAEAALNALRGQRQAAIR